MNNRVNCNNCNNTFNNSNEYSQHIQICIFYVYNSKYLKKISNELISNIVNVIVLFKLHKINKIITLDKETILLKLKNEFLIINSFLIHNNGINISNSNKEKEIILYFYNTIKQSNQNIYNYLDIINMISKLYRISNNDIINIINSYKICYDRCRF